MSEIRLTIDDKTVTAEKGMTILGAAKRAGIYIPTLCHHEKLEPFGGCRLCIVEIEDKGASRIVVSCVYEAASGLKVKTRSGKIARIRKMIIELLLAHAPVSPALLDLAKEYGADKNRFAPEGSFCIHCGLCVRYCNEVKKKGAIGFTGRGTNREISFIPQIALKECGGCKECFSLCPTSYLQATYQLVQALAFTSI
jgi:NADH dehydrogenase/NADH:ubiquinone oxidoreductase subunit G